MAETALGSTSTGEATAGSGNAGNPGSTASQVPASTGQSNSGTAIAPPEKTWRDSLPDDMKSNPSLMSFTDTTNLAKSYLHAQSQIGKKGAIVPNWDKSTPQEQSDFFKAIGVPEAKDYNLNIPKEFEATKEVTDAFKEVALKNGLLPRQASEVLGWYSKYEAEALKGLETAQAAEAKEQLEGLRKEWGQGYDRELSAAQLAVKEIGGPDFVKYLNETGMGNDVNLIRFAAKAAKLMGEDKLREGGVGDKMSTEDLGKQIQEIMAKGQENGYFDSKHPMHSLTVDKVASLRKQMTGGR